MPFETIIYDPPQAGERVVTITLNRPEVLNAIGGLMGVELMQAFRSAEEDPGVGCVILTGAGRGFCSGADVRVWDSQLKEGSRRPATDTSESLCQLMFGMKTPTIAAINGPAVGMGATITLPCDIRVASTEARIGFIFARVGLIAEFGSTFILPRVVGLAKAKELVLTARIIDAQEALTIGLVNRVVPGEKLMEETREMAKGIAQGPTFALGKVKEAIHRGLTTDLAAAEAWERGVLEACYRSPEHAEGVRAFMEKRQPTFHRR
jgi:2-(1,2-epoxy-1,2-dihydrophenyl)acetyl-CoA isomerase